MPVETNQNTDDPNNDGSYKTFGVEIGAGDNQITDRDLRRSDPNPNRIRPGGIPVLKDLTFPPSPLNSGTGSLTRGGDGVHQYVRFQAFHRRGNQASINVDLTKPPTEILNVDTPSSSDQSNAVTSQNQGTGTYQAIFANPDQVTPESQVAQQGDRRLGRATTDEPSDIVRLYIPNELEFTDNVEYTTESTGDVGRILEGALGGNAGSRLAEFGTIGALKKLDDLASTFVDGLDQSIRARFGFAVNPREEALFKNTTLKNFNMKFIFAPRNETEVDIVYNIIESFRFHMMPELSPSSFVLFAPAEFEIDFLYNAPLFESELPSNGEYRENESIPKLGRCLLKSLSVDYSPNVKSSFFRDGTATEIHLNLSFIQAAHLNRQMIMRGF
jgi:hypothetical protein